MNLRIQESKSCVLPLDDTPIHKNKISQQSIFKSDLRLANQCSRHIRSMVTIDLCLQELLVNNQPPWGTSPSRPCEILFPRNFQSMFSRNFSVSITLLVIKSFYSYVARRFLLLVPPTYVILAFLRLNYDITGCLALPTVTIIATTIVYWLILHWSVYYPAHRKRNFAIHINQYNNLKLSISLSIINPHESIIRHTNKYPCFACRFIHRFSAGYNPSALS